MSSLLYFIKESLTGFSRNLSTALGSIVTIFLSLFIIGVFLVGGVVVSNIVSTVEDQVSISIWLDDDASDAGVSTLQSAIRSIDGVSGVSYTSKDQALEDFKSSMSSNPEIVEYFGDENPLPASLVVELSDAQMIDSVVESILSLDALTVVCDTPDSPSDSLKYGQKTVEKLLVLTNYVRYIGIALIALLIFIAMVFINNTIRLAILARRKEIAIMRLVGASNGFIRGPFLMEGALHALIGAILALGCLELMRRLLFPKLTLALTWLPIDISSTTLFIIYLSLAVAGVVIGLIGSALAMRRYLKV